MSDRRVQEARVCLVHGKAMQIRSSGLYCPQCEKLGRHGHVIVAACPNSECGATLLNVGRLIKGYPAIRLGWRYVDEREGVGDHLLYVSAIWGDHTVQSDPPIKHGVVLDLFCPFCGVKFPKVAYCSCNAQMIKIVALYMYGESHGWIQICARRGCPRHKKGLLESGVDDLVTKSMLTGFRPGP